MRKLLLLTVTSLVLFGISAGVSWYLRHSQEAKEEAGAELAEKSGSRPEMGAKGSSKTAVGTEARSSLRPGYNPESEGTVHLAVNLRERLEAVRAREQQLVARQKNLDLIYQDIRSERSAIDELRKQVNEELKAVHDKMGDLGKKAVELDQKRLEGADQVKEIKKTMSEFEGVEQDRVKQMASMYDAMASENAAKILKQMVDAGNTDTAVKVLATMRERQAAKVLAELPDPSIAAQLLDKMKGLKKPTPVTKK